MKLLPCSHCKDGLAIVAFVDVGKGQVRPEPYWLESYPGGRVFEYECRRCRRVWRLSPIAFNAIPEASHRDLEQHGILDRVAKDLTLGGAVTLAHAKDLWRAGLRPDDLNALEPPA